MLILRLCIASVLLFAVAKLDSLLPAVNALCDGLAVVSYWALSLLFDSASIEGNILHLGDTHKTLQVSPVCSGLTFVMAGWSIIFAMGGSVRSILLRMLHVFIIVQLFNIVRLICLVIYLHYADRSSFDMVHETLFPFAFAFYLLMFFIYYYDWLGQFDINLEKQNAAK